MRRLRTGGPAPPDRLYLRPRPLLAHAKQALGNGDAVPVAQFIPVFVIFMHISPTREKENHYDQSANFNYPVFCCF